MSCHIFKAEVFAKMETVSSWEAIYFHYCYSHIFVHILFVVIEYTCNFVVKSGGGLSHLLVACRDFVKCRSNVTLTAPTA